MENRFARIIIDLSVDKLDRPYTYRIPEGLTLVPGDVVHIPFGRGNRTVSGTVIDLTDEAPEGFQIKEVTGKVPGKLSVEGTMLRMAWWMRERYDCTMAQAIKTVMPVKAAVSPVYMNYLSLTEQSVVDGYLDTLSRRSTAKKRAIEALIAEGREMVPENLLKERYKVSEAVIKELTETGILLLTRQVKYRSPYALPVETRAGVTLNEQQQKAVEEIRENLLKENKPWLLYGLTGSGKTEVYLALIDEMLAEKKQVIMLIPEIGLTYQTMLRFYRRLGDRVSFVHSRMSAGERYDQLMRAKSGQVDVMIGPRSALFSPFENLGLIIIDEEHETSYKSETTPCYDARCAAIFRASLSGAGVLMGSATPSLETFYRVKQGLYGMSRLTMRGVSGSQLANVSVVDMRQELREGNRSIFSRALSEAMQERLSAGEQIMLFLNRRGYANTLSCRSCGEVIMCPHCDVALTLHEDGMMVCHYCGYREKMALVCPACHKKTIAGLGIGTEKVAELTALAFPDARILRMDMDSTAKKGSHEAILKAFAAHEADILVGTQMIVKGHDFPNVTLMGVLIADRSLNAATYKAAERTFQILTQAAGRAGRGDRPGDVIIQTYRPGHFAIETAANQDYEGFYEKEIVYRKALHYPPAGLLLTVLVSAPSEEEADRIMGTFAGMLQKRRGEGMAIIGPSPDRIGKMNDCYRKIIYAKSDDAALLLSVKTAIMASPLASRPGVVISAEIE